MKPKGIPGGQSPEDLQEVLAEVRRIEAQSRALVGGILAGGYHSVFRGNGIEFEEIREFAEGDDPRFIDPSVTAKMGRPFVKVFVEERERSLLFLLDTSASMVSKEGAWTPRQMAARITACLALSAHRNDDRVGLLTYGSRAETYLPPKKGIGHILRILRDILALSSSPGRAKLAGALDYAGKVLKRPSSILILSDLCGENPESWEGPLSVCAKNHDVLTLRIGAEAPTAGGLRAMQDPETGERRILDFGSLRVRRAYTKAKETHRHHCTKKLRRHGAEILDFTIPSHPTMDSVLRPILSFFHKRRRQGNQ